jgi:hypothetical protein
MAGTLRLAIYRPLETFANFIKEGFQSITRTIYRPLADFTKWIHWRSQDAGRTMIRGWHDANIANAIDRRVDYGLFRKNLESLNPDIRGASQYQDFAAPAGDGHQIIRNIVDQDEQNAEQKTANDESKKLQRRESRG